MVNQVKTREKASEPMRAAALTAILRARPEDTGRGLMGFSRSIAPFPAVPPDKEKFHQGPKGIPHSVHFRAGRVKPLHRGFQNLESLFSRDEKKLDVKTKPLNGLKLKNNLGGPVAEGL